MDLANEQKMAKESEKKKKGNEKEIEQLKREKTRTEKENKMKQEANTNTEEVQKLETATKSTEIKEEQLKKGNTSLTKEAEQLKETTNDKILLEILVQVRTLNETFTKFVDHLMEKKTTLNKEQEQLEDKTVTYLKTEVSKLKEDVENMKKSLQKQLTALTNEPEQLTKETEALTGRSLVYKEQINTTEASKMRSKPSLLTKKPVQILDSVQTKAATKFTDSLVTRLKKFEYMVKKTVKLDKDIPLIVVCVQSTRLQADVELALQDLKYPKEYVLLIVHTGTERNLPSVPSSRLLNEYVNVYDIGFDVDNGSIYRCQQNDSVLETLGKYINNFSASEGTIV